MAIGVLVVAGCAETPRTSSEEHAATPTTAESTPTPPSTETAPATPVPPEKSEPEHESPPEPEKPPEAEKQPEREAPPAPEKGGECPGGPEGAGSSCHAEDAKFCNEHTCIANFPNGNGTVVECVDEEWSHSGGLSGACSHHGGEKE
jgi:hypothetical protein